MNTSNETTPPSAPTVEARVARLERTNRMLALALVGAIGLGAGVAMMAARQTAPPTQQAQQQPAPPQEPRGKPVSIVLDPTRSSGRWNSTLLAIDSDGIVYALDTSRPQSVWRRFQFSP